VNMKIKLEPCPFCAAVPESTLGALGKAARKELEGKAGICWCVRCRVCGATGPIMFTPKDSHTAWNGGTARPKGKAKP
jgi:hypothetical protein